MNGQPSHVPRRPSWLCRICETEWPCLTARSLLPIEYHADPLALRVYLGLVLYEATEDLYRLHPNPGPDPAELHARFLGWVDSRQGS
ncbi:hypothetical protein [Plantactinospora sp. B5E13]|uniref:hypothetical protein n=1 Tax=unclassified Plantactinospora TaxID=2631981 RepID=UPI00325E3D7C